MKRTIAEFAINRAWPGEAGVIPMDDREVVFNVVEANGFGAVPGRLETMSASVSRWVKALKLCVRKI